ncbi:MAG: radical SAM protein [bacterium]
MMNQDLSLEDYLNNGIERLVKNAIKASWKNPRRSLFFVRFAGIAKKAAARRQAFADNGEHIPSFLIASIARNCNLHCAGCYARANQSCDDLPTDEELTVADWERIFIESEALGILFILLAGGEPMLRPDVIAMAARHRHLLFPIFTNGTLIDETARALFRKNRHLLPLLSLEGDALATDFRRGKGTYANAMTVMEELSADGVLFGVSITVTRQNLRQVTGEEYLAMLSAKGCGVVIYVEYVPVNQDAAELALDDAARVWMDERLSAARIDHPALILVAFPGDEKNSGGCLAAGRGFFHINASGSAEPCPFSPYSDTNMKNTSVREALQSPLFRNIRDQHLLLQEHIGGCTLFEQEERVKDMLKKET